MAHDPQTLDATASGFPSWEVRLTKHLLVRRRERGVSIKEIRDTVEHPDLTYPSKEADCIRFVRKCGVRIIHIIGLKLPKVRVLILKTVMVLPTKEVMK